MQKKEIEDEKFTFVTCTYNHEKFIVLHLESIKFQVQHYFKGIKTYLIISDDGSSDSTLQLCKKWVDKNRDYFYEVLVLGDGMNRGTCKNYLRAVKFVKSNKFFFLAGDDLYGYRNLREILEYLDYYDLISAPSLAFYEDEVTGYAIEMDYNKYKTNIANGVCHKFMRRAFTIAGCLLEAPPTVFRKELLDERTSDFVGEYKLIEDQPMIYQFFKRNKVSMKYLDYSYIMYRINPNSVSHTKDKGIKTFANNDIRKLCKYYLTHEKNIIYLYIAFLRMQIIKGHSWVSFLLPTNHYLILMQKLFNKNIKNIYCSAVKDTALENLKYLKIFDENAKEFIEELKETQRYEQI